MLDHKHLWSGLDVGREAASEVEVKPPEVHFFEVFPKYRFMDSHRQLLTDNELWPLYKEEIVKDYEVFKEFR